MLQKETCRSLLIRMVAFAALLSTSTACCALGTDVHAGSQVNQIYLQRAVWCLAGDKLFRDYGLKFVDLKLGDWALAKFYMGSIIDRSYKGRIYNVVLYSKDMERSVLGSVVPNSKGDFDVVENGYLLKKHGEKWDVEEGNGGYRDYEMVGKFVTSISHKPFSRVHIVSRPKACSTDHFSQKTRTMTIMSRR